MAQSAVMPQPTLPDAADGELLQFMEIYGSADAPDPQETTVREQAGGASRSAATQTVTSSVRPLPESAAPSGLLLPTSTPATASIPAATAAEQARRGVPDSSHTPPHKQQAASTVEPAAAGPAKPSPKTPAAAAAQPAPAQQIWQLLARFVGQRPPGAAASDPAVILQAQLLTRQLPAAIYETRLLKDRGKDLWHCPSGRTVACCTLPHLGLQLTPRAPCQDAREARELSALCAILLLHECLPLDGEMCSVTSVGSDPLTKLLTSFKDLALAANKSKATAFKAARTKAERLAAITARVQASMLGSPSTPAARSAHSTPGASDPATLQSTPQDPTAQPAAVHIDPRPAIRLTAPDPAQQDMDQRRDDPSGAQPSEGPHWDPSMEPHCTVPMPVDLADLEDEYSCREVDLIAAGSLGGGPGRAELSRTQDLLLQTRWQRWRQKHSDLLEAAAAPPEQPLEPEAEGQRLLQDAEPAQSSTPLPQSRPTADASQPEPSQTLHPPAQLPVMSPPSATATPPAPSSALPGSSTADTAAQPIALPQSQAAPAAAAADSTTPDPSSKQSRPAAGSVPGAAAATTSGPKPSGLVTPAAASSSLATPQATASQAAASSALAPQEAGQSSSSEDDEDAWAMLHGSKRRTPKGAEAKSAAEAAADEAAKELLLGRKRKGSPLESSSKAGRSGEGQAAGRPGKAGIEIQRGAVESLPSISLLKCFQQLNGGIQRSLPQRLHETCARLQWPLPKYSYPACASGVQCRISVPVAAINLLGPPAATQKAARYSAIQQVLNKLQEAGVDTDP